MVVLSTGRRNTLTPNLGQRALLPCNLIPQLVLFLFVSVVDSSVFTGCGHVPKGLSFTFFQSTSNLPYFHPGSVSYTHAQHTNGLQAALSASFTTYLPIKITSCITSESTSISSRSRNIVLFVGVEMCSPHVVSLGDFFDYGYCYYASLRQEQAGG